MLRIPKDDIAFVPLKLPKTGEELLEGRQYEIDPVARAVIIEKYGIRPPRFVECIRTKQPERTVTTITEYADQRPRRVSTVQIPAQDETFRAFFKYKKTALFTIDLLVVEHMRPFYVDAPVEPDAEDDEGYKPKSKKKEEKTKLEFSMDDLLKL
jgi:hypothetical protein